jgi:nitroreductase
LQENGMELRQLVESTRSVRRFGREAVETQTLRELVDLGRLSASGGNKQPLKYILSADEATNAKIFPCTLWAGYLEDWDGPAEGERPAAYIVLLNDTELSKSPGVDHGIAAQSIVLGARERGLGACMIGSLKKRELAEALMVSDRYEILLVLALGVPGEAIRLEPVGEDGSIKYFRDDDGVHHVPKRALDDVILNAH